MKQTFFLIIIIILKQPLKCFLRLWNDGTDLNMFTGLPFSYK